MALAILSLPLSERLKEDWQAIRNYRQRYYPDMAQLVGTQRQQLEQFSDLA